MAGTFTATGSYSNLTRLELEQLRKSDFFAGGKALTVGDSGLAPEGVVGVGAINAEPYFTGPVTPADDVFAITPKSAAGQWYGTVTKPATVVATADIRWYGVDQIVYQGVFQGQASTTTQWQDTTAPFALVLPGDLLIVKERSFGGGTNSFVAGVVNTVGGGDTLLNLINISNPANGNLLALDSEFYQYAVVRPAVVQLFAVPGSGPAGQEQTFLMVEPTSTLHANLAPTPTQIEADRIRNLVPPVFNGGTADRADGVFAPPNTGGPNGNLASLGYRVVLYRSNPAGTLPDMLGPIAALNPVIDGAIDPADQRMTIDYKAGIVRFSVAPAVGDEIKPTGGTQGTNPTTGRLQLYAAFFAWDQTTSLGAVRALYDHQSTVGVEAPPARVFYDSQWDCWKLGTGEFDYNAFSVKVIENTSDLNQRDPGIKVEFGFRTHTHFGSSSPFRGFRLHVEESTAKIIPKMVRESTSTTMPLTAREVTVADKTALTVGDGSMPTQNPGGDYNPPETNGGAINDYQVARTIRAALVDSALNGYGTVHLRKGKYLVNKTVNVPPGVMVEGEGRATQLESKWQSGNHFWYPTVFKFGPNTTWGVYDFDTDEVSFTAAAVSTPLVSGSGTLCRLTPRDWTATGNLEGLDCVWNSTRRVWGVVYADLATDSIWFDEIRVDGTSVLGASMLNVKDGAAGLFTVTSVNGAEYTPAHYPRIDYQPYTDEYVVVWVEEQVAPDPVGPAVHWNIVKATYAAGVLSFATTLPNSVNIEPGTNTTQPSVAVGLPVSGSTYSIAISASNGYTPGGFSMSGRWRIFDPAGNLYQSGDLGVGGGTGHVISATDVSTDPEGGFLFAWTARRHRLWHGTSGTYATGFGAAPNTLTDPFFANWSAGGVVIGSRILIMGPTAADRGIQGTICGFLGAGTAYIKWDNDEQPTNVAGVFNYYVVPRSTIYTLYHNGASAQSPRSAVGGSGDHTTVPAAAIANVYFNDVREPDFCRLSKGDDGWILVYQSFDTNAFLTKTSIKNWDGGFNTALKDQTGGLGQSLTPHRLHLATCFVLISAQGILKGPGATNIGGSQNTAYTGLSTTATPVNFYLRAAADATITQRSLGGRVIALPNNNGITVPNGEQWEMAIGARYYSIPWSSTRSCSFIPDVTWSGQDWTVVSPSVPRIESDTGQYLFDGADYFISDPTMIWGGTGFQDIGVDGTPLPGTIGVGTYAYFPAVNQYVAINGGAVNTHSEHVIKLAGAVPGLVAGTVYTYRLVAGGNTIGDDYRAFNHGAGIKNPGFRVTSKGEVTVTTNFFTFADEYLDTPVISSGTYPAFYRQSEVIFRSGMWGDNNNFVRLFGTSRIPGAEPQINWNDLVPTSRLSFDLHYRGVAVGSPKGFSEQNTDEFPMVAISWGENFYGFLDRVVAGSDNINGVNELRNFTCFYRQSFGPWSGGLKDMAIKGAGNQKFRIEARAHVFTRHGWTLSGAPFFATDGFRNCFAHLGAEGFFDTAGTAGRARAMPYEDISYRGGICAVYTNVYGTDPLRIRGGIIQGPLTNEFSQDQFGFNSERNYQIPVQTQAPKVVWDGKHFVAFVPHMVVQGAHDPLSASLNVYYGTQSSQPKVRGVISMVRFPGDEATNVITSELNGAGIVEGVTEAIRMARPGSPNVVASTILSCGMSGDAEAREAVLFDVAFNGKVFCVVWVMSMLNTFSGTFLPAAGGSMVGYALFPVGAQPPADFLYASELFPVKGFGVPSHTIDINSLNAGFETKQTLSQPKVVWDGNQFVAVFSHMDNTTFPSSANRRNSMKYVVIPEDGFGNRSQLKAVGADNVIRNMQGGVENRLGQIVSGSLVLDNAQVATPQPGDLLVIVENSAVDAVEGSYIIVDYNPASKTVYVGVQLTGGGTIYGYIQSGGIPAGTQTIGGAASAVLNPNVKTNQPLAAGVDAPQTGLATVAQAIVFDGAAGTYPEPKDAGRVLALEYDWKTGEYIVLYHDDYADDLYITSFRITDGRCREPVGLQFSGTGAAHSMAFNGDSLLVVTANYDYIVFYHVSRDFQILSLDTYGAGFDFSDVDFLGSGIGQIPGPSYSGGTYGWFGEIGGVHAVWNDKLLKWSVSVSWATNRSGWVKNGQYATEGTAPYTYWAQDITSWTGRTLQHPQDPYDYPPGGRTVAVYQQQIVSTAGSFNNPNPLTAQDGVTNFTAAGVQVGDWLRISSYAGDMYRMVEAVGPLGINTYLSINWSFVDPPGTPVGFSSFTVIRPQVYFWWNQKSWSSVSDQTVIDVDASETTQEAFMIANMANFEHYMLPREDTFLLTFSTGSPAVEIQDADGVSLENLWLSGVADVSEWYWNMARQVHKSGGPEIGEVTAGVTDKSESIRYIRRPKVGLQLSTPAGKVETLTMTNVRSSALQKHSGKLTPNNSARDRANTISSNRRK